MTKTESKLECAHTRALAGSREKADLLRYAKGLLCKLLAEEERKKSRGWMRGKYQQSKKKEKEIQTTSHYAISLVLSLMPVAFF